MAKEMQADREAQNKAAGAADKKPSKAIATIGKSVAKKDDAVEVTVTTSNLLQPKEPPKLRITDFGEVHSDWKHTTSNTIKFWNSDVAELMTKEDLSFMKNDEDEDEFWLDPRHMDANKAGFRLLSTAVKKKAQTHLTNTMNIAPSGPAKPTDLEEDPEDDKASDYPNSFEIRFFRCARDSVSLKERLPGACEGPRGEICALGTRAARGASSSPDGKSGRLESPGTAPKATKMAKAGVCPTRSRCTVHRL